MRRKGAAPRAVDEQPAGPVLARLLPSPHSMATATFGTIRGRRGRLDALIDPEIFRSRGFELYEPSSAGRHEAAS